MISGDWLKKLNESLDWFVKWRRKNRFRTRRSGAVMDVCDLSSRQHAALRTVIKVTSRGGGDDDKVRWQHLAGSGRARCTAQPNRGLSDLC